MKMTLETFIRMINKEVDELDIKLYSQQDRLAINLFMTRLNIKLGFKE